MSDETRREPADGAFSTPSATMAEGTVHEGFVVESAQTVPEMDGCAYVMRHQGSGARLLWLACADENRSFSIAFKTPPANDTGVFHILEHSVLCGSNRYPVKEPFVNLLKTSMQTFLNALTFPDKTMYPVSSTNLHDLENLMDVYLDAVLHPAILSRPRIFEQEGWHYELDEDSRTLTHNGVVFNEMKGALSDPDEVLFCGLNRSLFPDSPYRFESGGLPSAIPELDYDGFIDTYSRHYRLDNAYVTLYGDLPIDHMLSLLDERFAQATDRGAAAPNALPLQAPVAAPATTVRMETAPENAEVGLAYVFATSSQRERVLAADVLLDALVGSNEAPLKRAVLDAGLGDDMDGYLLDGLLQPMVVFQLRGAHAGVADEFRALVERTCSELAERGVGHDNLDSSLAQAEFNLREGDWGYPDGIGLSIAALSGWLYDDADATSFLRYEDAFSHMRDGIDDGYFEGLLREMTVDCPHSALVDLVPGERDDDEAARLAERLASMDASERTAVAEEARALHAEQAAPDTAAGLATLPRLSVADVGEAAAEPVARRVDSPLPCVAYELPTHHIDYVYHYFDLDRVSWAELPYVSVLCTLLGHLDTQRHTALELDTLTEANLGALSFSVETYGDWRDESAARPKLVAGASAISERVEELASIPAEVWGSTVFADHDRIRDILVQQRVSMEQSFISSGHVQALAREASYHSAPALVMQRMAGIDFYRFLCHLLDTYDGRFQALCEILYNLAGRIFCTDNVEVSFVGGATDRERFWEAGSTLGLRDEQLAGDLLEVPEPKVLDEAFVVPADVCFASEGMDGVPAGVDQSGSWLVGGRALSFDYLWNEVRVLGGAYGCGFRCTPLSMLQFYSFRDPAVDPTLSRFEAAATWLDAWDPTPEEFEGYVVSAVAGMDAPLKPRALARRQDGLRYAGRPADWRHTVREQILSATPDSVRSCATVLAGMAAHHGTCVFGGRDVIEASHADLEVIDLMGESTKGGRH
jgi:Zn-dependent M16 (insulinase) family peptidase